ncbi:MAG: hypothetical protein HY828_17415 [Actinobacteria bacterium]|nr:hypothetical protein [Actinomycetota bacterium]
MGQQIAVVAKPSPTPGVVRYEANRNLTGMGHESFTSVGQAVGPRPAAALARQLLGTGQVAGVHIFGNIITVDILKGHSADGLDDVVRDLYQYWKPGMAPPSFEDLVPEAAAEAAPAAAGDAGGGADSEYLRRVPGVLVERSRAALAKWKANH